MGTDETDFLTVILRHIPGFQGYLRQADRAASDQQTKDWLSERFTAIKQPIDEHMRTTLAAGRIDELPAMEQLRNQLDHASRRLQSHTQGSQSFFTVDDTADDFEDKLEDLYDCDAHLMDSAEELSVCVGKWNHESSASGLTQAEQLVTRLHQLLDQRQRLINQLSE